MDQKTYELNRLNCLNECLCETVSMLARAQRIGLPATGLAHTPFASNIFGLPTMDPRSVAEYPGFSHSGYDYRNVVPFAYGTHAIAGWPAGPSTIPQTFVDPFVRERVGFTHTGLPTTSWTISPYAAEIERQRIQALLARQQYKAMASGWRPYGI